MREEVIVPKLILPSARSSRTNVPVSARACCETSARVRIASSCARIAAWMRRRGILSHGAIAPYLAKVHALDGLHAATVA
jgi:hypothetical protein